MDRTAQIERIRSNIKTAVNRLTDIGERAPAVRDQATLDEFEQATKEFLPYVQNLQQGIDMAEAENKASTIKKAG
jgi:uncharacterized protein YaaR (DUF327 family)